MQALVSGDSDAKPQTLIVSWESLEKKQAELEDLVKRKIPENVKEISVARSYGDLRENFEFKAAKEMQRVLSRRRSETERDLGMARGTDFANPDTAQVSIGTIVTLKEPSTGSSDVYTILGAWDGDPDKGIVSYQSALARPSSATRSARSSPCRPSTANALPRSPASSLTRSSDSQPPGRSAPAV
ncbi:MAG: GreA/GreB family elongation factor [Chthoniobacter sp.]